jgi:hypothetical protein
MVEEKGKMFVFEVFLNLNEILAHHRRTLRSLFARQRGMLFSIPFFRA